MNSFATDYLDQTALVYPDKEVFTDERRAVTYRKLREEARRIGTVLGNRGAIRKPVCVFMEKSVSCIAAMLGVLYSGNFYTVIDIDMPGARIGKIIEVLEPCAVITSVRHQEQAGEIFPCPAILYEDAQEQEIDEELLQGIRGRTAETDIMYVLFTSGSTGIPKGVVISHKAVIHYLEFCREEYHFNEQIILANQAPLYFVMTTLDIYLTIYAGASCHIIPQRMFSFPFMLLNFLKERRINTLYMVPSVLCYVANTGALTEMHLDDLKLVMFGGEVMPVRQMNQWVREYPDVRFLNLYGATEITDILTGYEVTRELDENSSLPIGKTASHMKTMILDEDGREVPEGEVGELCAAGPSLADGYYKDPEKTDRVFTPNPLYREGENPDFKRIYHLGDLVRIDENGDLIYIGRKDFQIKHMGHRIELGEIETAASSLDGVDQNCCVHDRGNDHIVLFYSGNLSEEEVNERLTGILSDYMVPTRYIKMKELPLNLNGKIDRAKLKDSI